MSYFVFIYSLIFILILSNMRKLKLTATCRFIFLDVHKRIIKNINLEKKLHWLLLHLVSFVICGRIYLLVCNLWKNLSISIEHMTHLGLSTQCPAVTTHFQCIRAPPHAYPSFSLRWISNTNTCQGISFCKAGLPFTMRVFSRSCRPHSVAMKKQRMKISGISGRHVCLVGYI